MSIPKTSVYINSLKELSNFNQEWLSNHFDENKQIHITLDEYINYYHNQIYDICRFKDYLNTFVFLDDNDNFDKMFNNLYVESYEHFNLKDDLIINYLVSNQEDIGNKHLLYRIKQHLKIDNIKLDSDERCYITDLDYYNKRYKLSQQIQLLDDNIKNYDLYIKSVNRNGLQNKNFIKKIYIIMKTLMY